MSDTQPNSRGPTSAHPLQRALLHRLHLSIAPGGREREQGHRFTLPEHALKRVALSFLRSTGRENRGQHGAGRARRTHQPIGMTLGLLSGRQIF